MTPRVALLLNPHARAGSRSGLGARVRARLMAGGVQVCDIPPGSRAQTEPAVRHALESRPDALVAVGGDGTLHLALRAGAGLDAPAVPLGVVPGGSGNDVAMALGVPTDPVAATDRIIDALHQGRRHRVDVMRVECGDGSVHQCLGVLSLGFDALVNARANSWRWPPGRVRYPLAVLRELPGLRGTAFELSADDGPLVRRSLHVVAVANGQAFGGRMRIAPDAVVDDGLLDVVTVASVTRRTLLRVLPRIFDGGHVRHWAVDVQRATRLGVAAPGRALVAYADGEPLGPLPVRVTVRPGTLLLLG